MNENKLISVIVPVYNVEKYLPRCLDSIINNTYQNLEIICIDDGSTDGSLTILRSYEKRDNRIKVITKENGGLSSARNAGLEKCTGDFVAFIDSDDWIHREYFSILIKIQYEKDYDVVVCAYWRTKDQNCMNYNLVWQQVRELDRNSYMVSHETKRTVWGRIYKRSILEGILFDEKMKIEDTTYNMMVALKNPHLIGAYVDLALYAYYIRENSLVSFLEARDTFQLAEQYFLHATEEEDAATKELLYKECLKSGLYVRYNYRLDRDKEGEKQCNSLMKNCLKRLSSERCKYSIPVRFPSIYRLRCIIKDPTMIQYEKNVMYKRKLGL